MKIGFFEVEPWMKSYFKKSFPNDNLFFFTSKFTSKYTLKCKDLEVISIFVNSHLDQQVLQQLSRLKLISTRSTGYDHVDVDYCKKKSITVCNVPVYGENTVAEHAFALILGLSRKLIECVERAKKGSFNVDGLRGFDLKGKTLGVVGCGNIGKNMVRIGKGFGMNILGFDVVKDEQFCKEIGFDYVTLEKVLKQSDIVTLHVPLNKHTYHLIDVQKLKMMKKGAYLINTSRGEVVDTTALISALRTGKLAGAGLDVLEGEEQDGKRLKTLIKMPQVLVTPHNAFNTQEAVFRIMETTVKNIKEFKKGKKTNQV